MKRFKSWAAMFLGFSLLAAAPAVFADDAAGGDGPIIEKDSIQVTAYTNDSYQKDFDVWSWTPAVEFRVKGPIADGSQFWMEVKPATGPAIKFDIPTEQLQKGHFKKMSGGGRDVPEDQATLYTGAADFTIHVRNEVTGNADAVLFSGKFNVDKVHSNGNKDPKFAQKMVYFVNQDWNLPIAYLFLTHEGAGGKKAPNVNAAFWVRGEPGVFKPHLLYQGKEVGKIIFEGDQEMGKASAEPDLTDQPSQFVDTDLAPQKAQWERIVCKFPNVVAWDNRKPEEHAAIPGQKGSEHSLKDNPGDYEIKVLRNGKLARSIKFTIGADGKFDQGITVANKMGDERAIVPVAILDDQDGRWNQDAWKADAFYGNPLAGFTAIPGN